MSYFVTELPDSILLCTKCHKMNAPYYYNGLRKAFCNVSCYRKYCLDQTWFVPENKDFSLEQLCELFTMRIPILDKNGDLCHLYQEYFRFDRKIYEEVKDPEGNDEDKTIVKVKSKFEFINGSVEFFLILHKTIENSPLCILASTVQYDNISFILNCKPEFNVAFITNPTIKKGYTPVHAIFTNQDLSNRLFVKKMEIYQLFASMIPSTTLEPLFLKGLGGCYNVSPLQLYQRSLNLLSHVGNANLSFDILKGNDCDDDDDENEELISQMKALRLDSKTNPLALLGLIKLLQNKAQIPFVNDILFTLYPII